MVNDQYRWMRAQAYPRRDEEGRIIRWYGYTEDIHESVLIEEQMRWNAEHDSLTELPNRSEEHKSEIQSLMRISYAVFCLKTTTKHTNNKKYINDKRQKTQEP